jgi:hypothetical protein
MGKRTTVLFESYDIMHVAFVTKNNWNARVWPATQTYIQYILKQTTNEQLADIAIKTIYLYKKFNFINANILYLYIRLNIFWYY